MGVLEWPQGPLIEALRSEHRGLLKRHGEVEKLVLAGRFEAIPHELAAFKAKFNVHALREGLHCYDPIERGLARRSAELAAVTKLHQEMDAIGRQVLDFVEKYRSSKVTRGNAQEFLNGLRAVGQLLAGRFKRVEAELFGRYQP